MNPLHHAGCRNEEIWSSASWTPQRGFRGTCGICGDRVRVPADRLRVTEFYTTEPVHVTAAAAGGGGMEINVCGNDNTVTVNPPRRRR